MTLGQRIQELRKGQALSQEALGEKLGVSRQAISKWESDLTIPEIDKLVALSKLFGVTVGWLLGVEPEPEAEQPQPEVRLEAPLPQPVPKRWWKMLTALELAAVLLLGVGLLNDQSTIERLRSDLQQNQMEISGLRNELLHVRYPTQTEENTAQLVETWDYTLLSLQPDDKCRIRVRAMPKTYRPEEQVQLAFRMEDGTSVVADGVWDGQEFVFEETVDAHSYVTFRYLRTDQQGTQEGQLLGGEDLGCLIDNRVDGSLGAGRFKIDNKGHVTVEQEVILVREIISPYNEIGEVLLELWKNGQVADSQTIPLVREWDVTTVSPALACDVQVGDELILRYTMTDKLGGVYQSDLCHYRVEKWLGGLELRDVG